MVHCSGTLHQSVVPVQHLPDLAGLDHVEHGDHEHAIRAEMITIPSQNGFRILKIVEHLIEHDDVVLLFGLVVLNVADQETGSLTTMVPIRSGNCVKGQVNANIVAEDVQIQVSAQDAFTAAMVEQGAATGIAVAKARDDPVAGNFTGSAQVVPVTTRILCVPVGTSSLLWRVFEGVDGDLWQVSRDHAPQVSAPALPACGQRGVANTDLHGYRRLTRGYL